jgi:hypothetical protein
MSVLTGSLPPQLGFVARKHARSKRVWALCEARDQLIKRPQITKLFLMGFPPARFRINPGCYENLGLSLWSLKGPVLGPVASKRLVSNLVAGCKLNLQCRFRALAGVNQSSVPR